MVLAFSRIVNNLDLDVYLSLIKADISLEQWEANDNIIHLHVQFILRLLSHISQSQYATIFPTNLQIASAAFRGLTNGVVSTSLVYSGVVGKTCPH